MPVLRTLTPAGILIVTISRPDALNALNVETLDELRGITQEIYQNTAIRGVIITGAGEKAFVAGADIKEFSGLDREKALKLAQKGQNIFQKLEDCPKPVIAAINGFALGGGCELAMACHVRIAVESAKFGQPEVNLGIIPGYGGTQRLTQLVGKGKAFELILTGDMIPANEAKNIGLVNHVVSNGEELLKLAESIVTKMITKAPLAIAHAIKSINTVFTSEDGYLAEATNFAACATTQDFKEGAAAFVEKRKPSFTGA